jgi:hypothetical protein
MNRQSCIHVCFFTFAIALVPLAARAQAGPLLRRGAEEAAEMIMRRSGQKAAGEIAEFGGQTALRESLEKIGKESGDEIMKKAGALAADYGPTALRSIERSPKAMTAALDKLSPQFRQAAIHIVDRDPKIMVSLVERYGSDALEAAARHPGIGATLTQKLGAQGIVAARKATTNEAIILARHADEINALAPTTRQAVLGAIGKAPAKAAAILEKNPKLLLTAAGVAIFLGAKDSFIGTTATPGLIERMTGRTFEALKTPVYILCGLLLAGAAGYLIIGLRAYAKTKSLKNAQPSLQDSGKKSRQ